jgi:ABC-type transporter Mla subunit MlaD
MAGKWLGALLGMLVLAGIGAILGAVVWYTRPARSERDHQRKVAMLEADLQIRNAYEPG